MKIVWIKIIWNSILNGWIDCKWGCKATWVWYIKKCFFSNKFLWALVDSYLHQKCIKMDIKKEDRYLWHFVIPTGSCMMCEKEFEQYDATKDKDFVYFIGFGGKWVKELIIKKL